MVITSRGVEIERIMEYDVLSSILHDMNFIPAHRKTRAHEGHGSQDLFYGDP